MKINSTAFVIAAIVLSISISGISSAENLSPDVQPFVLQPGGQMIVAPDIPTPVPTYTPVPIVCTGWNCGDDFVSGPCAGVSLCDYWYSGNRAISVKKVVVD